MLEAIGWNMSGKVVTVDRGPVDMAYVPELNEWNGKISVQCKLTDVRSAEIRDSFPTRDMLGGIYIALKKMKRFSDDVETLAKECNISVETMKTALKIFEELGLAAHEGVEYRLAPQPKQKLDLMDSPTYRNGKLKQN